jgi:large conductance mechanosensitive channel
LAFTTEFIDLADRKNSKMKMIEEFRAFAVRGNVIDLAVGVIIGGAFGKIVDSVVGDVIMPVIAWLIGGKLDFSNLFIVLGKVPENVPMTLDALKKAGVPLFAYGNFLTIIIFQMVKIINRIKLQDEAAAPPVPEDIQLLREIRDSLKK